MASESANENASESKMKTTSGSVIPPPRLSFSTTSATLNDLKSQQTFQQFSKLLDSKLYQKLASLLNCAKLSRYFAASFKFALNAPCRRPSSDGNVEKFKKDCRCRTRIKHNENTERSLVEILKFITSFRLSVYSLQRVEYIN